MSRKSRNINETKPKHSEMKKRTPDNTAEPNKENNNGIIVHMDDMKNAIM